VSSLPVAAALKSAGFHSWWLDADTVSARTEFKRLGKSLDRFDVQVDAIEAARSEIMRVFRPNVLMALDQTRVRLDPEKIWAHIQGAI
jgi:hypothetical protein